MTNTFRFTLVLMTHYTTGLQLVSSKTNKIGDTEYKIYCSDFSCLTHHIHPTSSVKFARYSLDSCTHIGTLWTK
jgi:hypothetical protein